MFALRPSRQYNDLSSKRIVSTSCRVFPGPKVMRIVDSAMALEASGIKWPDGNKRRQITDGCGLCNRYRTAYASTTVASDAGTVASDAGTAASDTGTVASDADTVPGDVDAMRLEITGLQRDLVDTQVVVVEFDGVRTLAMKDEVFDRLDLDRAVRPVIPRVSGRTGPWRTVSGTKARRGSRRSGRSPSTSCSATPPRRSRRRPCSSVSS